jgi:hypothetical protein
VPPDQEAAGPSGHVVRVKADAGSSFEKHAEHYLRLEAGEGRPDTVVDASPECQVEAGYLALQVDLVGPGVFGCIAVGGAVEQQDRGTGRDVDAAERCVGVH